MRLSRGHVGDEEGNVSELAAEDRALLLQVGVVAHYLVAPEQGVALAVACNGLAVLAHLEGAGNAVSEQIAVVGGRLGYRIGSVRQRVGCGLGGVGSLLGVPSSLDHGHDGALGPVGVLHHDAVLGCVHDRELDALKGAAEVPFRIERRMIGSSQGLALTELKVVLLNLDASAHHLVQHAVGLDELVELAVFPISMTWLKMPSRV